MTLDAMPGKSYEGKVFAINPLIDAAGRSVVIRAQVHNQDATLRPGMFARVRLFTREVQDALVVPSRRSCRRATSSTSTASSTARRNATKVEIGQRRDGKAEIVKGCRTDDVVVTAGQLKLREGVPVQRARRPSRADGAAPRRTPAQGATPAKAGSDRAARTPKS